MDLKVKILADETEELKLDVAHDATYGTVLGKLNINPEEVVVLRDGTPVPEDEPVAEKTDTSTEITIIRIISVG
jgi:sulfur carrier protein